MPNPKVESEEVLDRLTDVFRKVGYDGATLSKLSEATGLQRASLYHRFPGGKKEMAEEVLDRASVWFQENVIVPLTSSDSPRVRLEKMGRRLDAFYSRGNSSCLLDTLSFGEGGEMFQAHIQQSFTVWIEALAKIVLEATGCSKSSARRRGEHAVLLVQGALVLARGTGSNKAFQRVLRDLPDTLLHPTD